MKVYLASDHAGFELKKHLTSFLEAEGYDVEDIGPHTFDAGDDYPDYMFPLAEKVRESGAFGIALGGSGQGEAIALNKVEGVRAGVWYGGDKEIVKLLREHNDARILSLGARFISSAEAEEVVQLFISTSFSDDERHVRRLKKITEYGE